MRRNSFLAFGIIAVTVLLIEWYAYQALRTVTSNKLVHWIYFGFSAVVYLNMLYQFAAPSDATVLDQPRSYAMGWFFATFFPKLIIIFFIFGEDIVRFVVGLFGKAGGDDFHLPGRRKFISQIALGLAAVPFASLIYGMYKGKYRYRVVAHELFFPDLPAGFDGYTITQISDVHSGSFDNAKKINYGIDMINAVGSDTIVFTGDLVNNLASEMTPWKESFARLRAPDGVYSILGNHDYGTYYRGFENEAEANQNFQDVCACHGEMGWQLLRDEHVIKSRGGDQLAIVGVENIGGGNFIKAGDLNKANEGLDPSIFRVLLSHDPSHFEDEVSEYPIKHQLTLSGHTHGMQFGIEIPGWIKWSPVQWRYPRWAGVYESNDRLLNVNRGFGFLAYPGRVGIWPEITKITLRKGERTA